MTSVAPGEGVFTYQDQVAGAPPPPTYAGPVGGPPEHYSVGRYGRGGRLHHVHPSYFDQYMQGATPQARDAMLYVYNNRFGNFNF